MASCPLSEKEILEIIENNSTDEEDDYDSEEEDEESDRLSVDSSCDDIISEDDEILYLLPDKDCEFLKTKDETLWYCTPQYQGRTPAPNIVRGSLNKVILPPGNIIEDASDAFQLFIHNNIITTIINMTNKEAERVYRQKRGTKTWKCTTCSEMKAFIGVLLSAGHLKSADVSVDRLWSKKYGPPILQAAMSKNRFKEILRFMRFDDKDTRSNRRIEDKLACIRDVWEQVNSALGKYYRPSCNLTVDEQLVGFDGKCPFKQYIPLKPEKYGMKIFWLNDSQNGYPLAGIPYLGKDGNTCTVNLGERIVEKLCIPYHYTNRSVTCNNFFTTKQLALNLRRSGLTLMGTLRKNKPYIPKKFLADHSREEFSSLFGFTKQLTIVSYVPEKGKAVVLLSTMHHDNKIVEDNLRKPEIIIDYNKTKGGTDLMDQMIHSYTCKRKVNRWPMAFFMNLLDVACIAGYIVYTNLYKNWNPGKNDIYNTYLEAVSEELIWSHMHERLQSVKNKSLKRKILAVSGYKDNINSPLEKKQRGQCCLCKSDRRVFQHCSLCEKNVCKEHSKMICNNCFNEV